MTARKFSHFRSNTHTLYLVPLGLSLIVFGFLFAIQSKAAQAQGVQYVLHEIPLVQQNSPFFGVINGMNQFGMVIGSHTPGGIKTGFVYDHFGLLGNPGAVHSLTEWITNPPGFPFSSCVGINEMGQIVGLFEATVGTETNRAGYLLDLDMFAATPAPFWRYLPIPLGATSSYGRRINNLGLVCIESQYPDYAEYLFDSSDPDAELQPIVDPSTNTPDSSARVRDLTDAGHLAGDAALGGYLLQPGISLQYLPIRGVNLNEHGILAGHLPETKDSRGRIVTQRIACRYSIEIGLEPLSNLKSGANDINDDSDVLGTIGANDSPAYFHADLGTLYLDDFTTGIASDLALWFDTRAKRNVSYMTNRDATGFGQLVGQVSLTTTTGKGKNAVTTTVVKSYLLVPQSL